MRRALALALLLLLCFAGEVWADDFNAGEGGGDGWGSYTESDLIADHDTTPIESSTAWEGCC